MTHWFSLPKYIQMCILYQLDKYITLFLLHDLVVPRCLDLLFTLSCLGIAVVVFATVASSASPSLEDNILPVLPTCYYSNPLGDHRVPKCSDSNSFFRETHIPTTSFGHHAVICPYRRCSSTKFVRSIRDRVFSKYERDLERIITGSEAFCRAL